MNANGGPAFPTLQTQWNDKTHEYDLGKSIAGMSLRDYFAAKSLAALISAALTGKVTRQDDGPLSEDDIAEQAYLFADAMLAARSQP